MTNFDLLVKYCSTARVGDIFTGTAIREGMQKQFGTNPTSIIPSDYCYNRKNKAPYIPERVLFEYLGRNQYRYLGLGYAYTGQIFHRPRGVKQDVVVGSWLNGRITLLENL